mgnify:CR=1 FL=1
MSDSSGLHVVTTHSNPLRYKSRDQLLDRWLQRPRTDLWIDNRERYADAVVLRSGQPPMSRDGAASLTPMRALAQRTHLRLSADGRLAATAGIAESTPPQTYQRAWRHASGGWCVAVDLVGD